MKEFEALTLRFTELYDEERALQMAAYMKNKFLFFGIPAPKRRNQYRDVLSNAKRQGDVDWHLLDQCWDDPHREFQYVVYDYLAALQKHLTYEDVSLIKRYVSTKPWWDTIDPLSKVIGRISDERIKHLMLEWSQDSDFWLNRTAILHQLEKKENADPVLLEQILTNNLGSKEFFINKAIGWSLRDRSKTDPAWVKGFIEENRAGLSSLSIREGSKYIR